MYPKRFSRICISGLPIPGGRMKLQKHAGIMASLLPTCKNLFTIGTLALIGARRNATSIVLQTTEQTSTVLVFILFTNGGRALMRSRFSSHMGGQVHSSRCLILFLCLPILSASEEMRRTYLM